MVIVAHEAGEGDVVAIEDRMGEVVVSVLDEDAAADAHAADSLSDRVDGVAGLAVGVEKGELLDRVGTENVEERFEGVGATTAGDHHGAEDYDHDP